MKPPDDISNIILMLFSFRIIVSSSVEELQGGSNMTGMICM